MDIRIDSKVDNSSAHQPSDDPPQRQDPAPSLNGQDQESAEATERGGKKFDATSALLWVAAGPGKPSISPLHYDLSDGLILQLHGEKRLLLFEPGHTDIMYPSRIDSPFDRQSMIDRAKRPGTDFKQSRVWFL